MRKKDGLDWLSTAEIEHKTIEAFEWSMGNGQCELCHGTEPNAGWWTDTVGHHKKCPLAKLMEKAGMNPVFEHPNPERSVGSYIPNHEKGKGGFIASIRWNDPDKEKKLKMGYEQDVLGVRSFAEALRNSLVFEPRKEKAE